MKLIYLCLLHVFCCFTSISAMSVEERVKEIFRLYHHYGNEDYLGEEVSQVEHATQCAMQAEKEGYPTDVSYNDT